MISSENALVLILGRDEAGSDLALLMTAAGFRSRWVQSPEELRYVAKSIAPDLILINVLTRGFNFELCRALKSDPLTESIGILILATATARGDRLNAIQCGVDDFIVQPFDPDEMMIRLRNVVVKTRQTCELKLGAARLQQLEEARAELTRLVVRDMKTPLTGLADLLEMTGGATSKHFKVDASRFVNEALGATETLEELIEFLMSVRKMMAGEEVPDKQPCDILQLSRYISEALSESALAMGITLAVEGEGATVLCDKPQMTRVIRHLIRMAIKSKPLENQVRIRISRMAGRTKLCVVCAGGPQDPTIDADGLGLTYCRLVTAAHGGDLGVAPNSGEAAYLCLTLPEAVGIKQAAASAEVFVPGLLEKSRRYIGVFALKGKETRSRSLIASGTRQQFAVVVALMSVIPLLAFAYVLGNAIMTDSLDAEALFLLLPSIVGLMALGAMLLVRHTLEVNRLRRYLEAMSRGGAPLDAMDQSSEDFAAIQRSIGAVMKQGTEQVKVIEAKSKALVQAEQQRVMVETVGAACHHLGQPATIIRGYLELMKRAEVSPEMRDMIQECQAATEDVATVLHRLKGVGQYETEPYLSSKEERVGRADERILKI